MKRVVFSLFLVLTLALASGSAYAAPPAQQQQSQCLIVAPATGSQVRGQAIVQGSANHPNFTWYQVGYAADPNPTGEWTFFFNSEAAVNNGQLAVWDTRALPDGVYQLLVEVHRNDGNFDLCFAGRIRVNNSQPTPTFTAVPLPTAADTPTAIPTAQATATVLVEQPPTATPRATPTYSAVDNPTPTPEETRFQLPIEPASITNASCRGAQLTVLAAVAIALYFVFRGLAVTGLRKLRRQDDVQGFHKRRPREF